MKLHRRFIYHCVNLFWRFCKPLTLGSRAIVVQDEKVLLVRLSYVKGWYLPGGGVAKGESFYSGAIRELKEECGIVPKKLVLFGLYFTTRHGKVDHVAIFLVTEFSWLTDNSKDPEIDEMRFFPFDSLPEETTPATKRRIQEYLSGSPRSDQW